MKPELRQFAKPKDAPFPNNPIEFRHPPEDIDAESAVLGSMILSPHAVFTVQQYLKSEDFYREAHRQLFTAIVTLEDKKEPVEIITLTNELKRMGEFEAVGGISALTMLIERVPTAANAEYYAQIVKEKSQARRAITEFNLRTAELYEGVHPQEVLNKTFNFVTTDFGKSIHNFECDFKDLVLKTVDEIALTHQGKRKAHIQTHYRGFDAKWTGWECGGLTILKAPPKIGKSHLMINSADKIASHQTPVGYMLLDMKTKMIPYRFLSRRLKRSIKQIQYGIDINFKTIQDEAQRFVDMPIRVAGVDEIGTDYHTAIRFMQYAKKNFGTKIFFVDSFQKFDVKPEKGQTDESFIAAMINDFQKAAQQLDVPIVGTVDLGYSGQAKGSSRWSFGPDAVFKLVYNPAEEVLKIESEYLRNGEPGDITLTTNYSASEIRDYEPKQAVKVFDP